MRNFALLASMSRNVFFCFKYCSLTAAPGALAAKRKNSHTLLPRGEQKIIKVEKSSSVQSTRHRAIFIYSYQKDATAQRPIAQSKTSKPADYVQYMFLSIYL